MNLLKKRQFIIHFEKEVESAAFSSVTNYPGPFVANR